MADRKIQVIIGFKADGADRAAQATRGVSTAVENLTKKLRAADFTVIGDLEKKLRSAQFGFAQTGQAAGQTAQSFGISAYQAQQLSFQVNDVIASLASGGSAFRILAQQGGQVTQIFGGVRGTFSALVPVLARFAPLIAAIGAVGAGAALIKMSFGAAQSATEMQKAADEAGLTADQFQRLTQASSSLGLDAKGVISGVSAVGKAANTASDDLNGGLIGALFDAGSGVVGLSKTAENGVPKIKLYGKELKGAEGIAAALGVSFKDSAGEIKDSSTLTFDLARALAKIKDPALQARAATEIFGGGASSLLPKIRQGVGAIDEFQRKTQTVKPEFGPGDFKFAQEIDKNIGLASEKFGQFGKTVREALLPVGIEASRIAVELASSFGNIQIDPSWIQVLISGLRLVSDTAKSVGDAFSIAFDVFNSVTKDAADALLSLGNIDVSATLSATWESIKSGASDAWQSVQQTFTNGISALANIDFGALLSSMWDGVKSAAESAYNYVAGVFARISALISGAAQTLASLVTGGSGGEPQAKASGGMIRGPGTATSDSILARLSNGEYVIKAAAVRHFGPGVFHALNNLRTPKFALGGLVGGLSLRMPSFDIPSFASGGMMEAAVATAPASSGRSFSLVLDGQSFSGLTGPADTLNALEKRATQRNLSRTMRRKPSWA